MKGKYHTLMLCMALASGLASRGLSADSIRLNFGYGVGAFSENDLEKRLQKHNWFGGTLPALGVSSIVTGDWYKSGSLNESGDSSSSSSSSSSSGSGSGSSLAGSFSAGTSGGRTYPAGPIGITGEWSVGPGSVVYSYEMSRHIGSYTFRGVNLYWIPNGITFGTVGIYSMAMGEHQLGYRVEVRPGLAVHPFMGHRKQLREMSYDYISLLDGDLAQDSFRSEGTGRYAGLRLEMRKLDGVVFFAEYAGSYSPMLAGVNFSQTRLVSRLGLGFLDMQSMTQVSTFRRGTIGLEVGDPSSLSFSAGIRQETQRIQYRDYVNVVYGLRTAIVPDYGFMKGTEAISWNQIGVERFWAFYVALHVGVDFKKKNDDED